MIVFILILAVALIALYSWQSRGRSRRPQKEGAKRMPRDVERWLEADLLSEAQASAITSFEERVVPDRKIPLFAEALGYIGAVLALAGGGAAIGQIWEDLAPAERAGIVGAASVLAFVAGWLIRSQLEPAIRRMMSVLWGLSVGGMAATMALLFVDVIDLTKDALGVTIGGIIALYAALLYLYHRQVLQVVALFGSGLATVLGLVVVLPGQAPDWGFAIATWAYGGAWLTLGWYELVTPGWSAVALGAVVGSYGPSVSGGSDGWLLAVGLVSSALLMALGIYGRTLPLLAIGSLGAFGYLTGTVIKYFGDTLGVPLALGIVGILVIALAVGVGRTGTIGRAGWWRPPGHPAA